MAEKQPEKNEKSQKAECLPDSDASDKELVANPLFPTTNEERHHGTIPSSASVTRAALSHSTAQTNPTVKRGPPCQKTKVKKLPKENAEDKASQADSKEK